MLMKIFARSGMKKFDYFYVYFKPSDEMLEEKINLEKVEERVGNTYVDVDWILEDAQGLAERLGAGSIPLREGRIEVRLRDQKGEKEK